MTDIKTMCLIVYVLAGITMYVDEYSTAAPKFRWQRFVFWPFFLVFKDEA